MRKVRVASVTAPALEGNQDLRTDLFLDRAITFWREEIQKVLPDKPDLVVLPELCDHPWVGSISEEMQKAFAHEKDDRFLNFLQGVARENSVNVVYPTYRRDESGRLRNSCVVLDRQGVEVGHYDKNHLVTFENIERRVDYGTEVEVLDLDFGRVGFAICFDLNFTELLERYRNLGIELMIFPSEYHGGLMQGYWAYQLRAYFLSSVRPPAPSSLLSPLGEVIATTTNYFSFFTHEINLDYVVLHLDGHVEKLQQIKKKYGSSVSIVDPGRLGAIMILSETESVSTADLVREFSLTLLDDYLNASRKHRGNVVAQ